MKDMTIIPEQSSKYQFLFLSGCIRWKLDQVVIIISRATTTIETWKESLHNTNNSGLVFWTQDTN